MRTWTARVLFVGLLLGALAARIQASHEPADQDERPAIAALLASRGIDARVMPADEGALLKAVTFDAPQCGGHVNVFPVRLNLQEAPLFEMAVGQGREQRIAYITRTWDAPSRLDLHVEWLKQKALSVAGRGTFTANTTALLIASPKGCALARSIDWAPFWRHDLPKI